jgi:hypothetical protein
MPRKGVAAKQPAAGTSSTSRSTPKPAPRKGAAPRAAAARGRRRFDPDRYITNVVPSKDTQDDWTLEDSLVAGAVGAPAALPAEVDLRQPWWSVNDQEHTGSCVGWATADGLLRQMFVEAGRLGQAELLSPRFIWMAAKETDTIAARPETFIEEAGTTLKAAVDVARKYGVATMADLPFHLQTAMYLGTEKSFYARCARLRVASYFNLHKDPHSWRTWLAGTGPILAALSVDAAWDGATGTHGLISGFRPDTVRGGHAICVVGYRADGRFIVRNSWGTTWGDHGFGYVDEQYVADAFFGEAYGVTL